MEASAIYTRAYSSKSNRQLVSGKAHPFYSLDEEYPSLCPSSLQLEFRNHCKRYSKTPTALVSTSSRILDTIKRAYELWQAGEDAEDVWVVFIKTPGGEEDRVTRIHHAEALAEQYGDQNPKLFRYEFVFEWIIPRYWVEHKVLLKTLEDRRLGWAKNFPRPGWISSSHMGNAIDQPPSISLDDLRRCKSSMSPDNDTPWDIGLYMGCITKCFGARAPLGWVVKQLFEDLFRPCYSQLNMVTINSNDDCYTMDVDQFKKEFDDGVDFIIIDWVTESQFVADDEYCKAEMEWLLSRLDCAEMDDFASEAILVEMNSLELEAVSMGL